MLFYSSEAGHYFHGDSIPFKNSRSIYNDYDDMMMIRRRRKRRRRRRGVCP
jgi:hypothetical protein